MFSARAVVYAGVPQKRLSGGEMRPVDRLLSPVILGVVHAAALALRGGSDDGGPAPHGVAVAVAVLPLLEDADVGRGQLRENSE